jgi:oxygen-independent coproporphyrinogen-3 oxidase
MTERETNLPILPVRGKEQTTVGNYFVSNYPPYSFWSADEVPAVEAALDAPAGADVPLGLYVHIPFCRKRCDFCYFKVYTDKNSAQIRRYLDAVIDETTRLAARRAVAGRPLSFVYFGGGTPSYLSAAQLSHLFDGLRARLPWADDAEIAFECEPGTLPTGKVQALRDLGVTRLSLGVENFDPEILERNNRAHRAKEIFRAYGDAREAGFPQVNIDLIAGMIGETDENWAICIEKTLELAPESVTIYQMEIPYNTTIYGRMKEGQTRVAPVADWETKRRWVSEAFDRLFAAGYRVGSAYTAVKNDDVDFVYRDALWHGADMLGVGVSSISNLSGVLYQNEHQFDPYVERVEAGELPVHRAHRATNDERFIREFVLQMKLGDVGLGYFAEKFGVDVAARYAEPLRRMETEQLLTLDGDRIRLSRRGLLIVDRLLPDFFLEEHRDARYA